MSALNLCRSSSNIGSSGIGGTAGIAGIGGIGGSAGIRGTGGSAGAGAQRLRERDTRQRDEREDGDRNEACVSHHGSPIKRVACECPI